MAELIRVSAQSRSTAVAGAIAGVMREQEQTEMQAIGASAVNQAIKAVAIARGYLEQDGIDLVIAPMFTEVEIEGNERTAVRITIYRRPQSMLNGNGVYTRNGNGTVKSAVNGAVNGTVVPSLVLA